MSIAICQLAPRIADANHGLVLKNSAAEPFRSHPGPLNESYFVLTTKPVSAAKFPAVIHAITSTREIKVSAKFSKTAHRESLWHHSYVWFKVESFKPRDYSSNEIAGVDFLPLRNENVCST